MDTPKTQAPPDLDAEAAYQRVVTEAAKFGILTFAHAGVAVVMLPKCQREDETREETLEACGMKESD